MSAWILLVIVYAAPPSAVNWDGPWKLGMWQSIDRSFTSEAECRNFAIQFIAKMHEGMLAPMRYNCVRVASTLPRGAPR